MTTTTTNPITHLIDATLYAQVIELENVKAAQKSLEAKGKELKLAITAKMYDMPMTTKKSAKVTVDAVDDAHFFSAREVTLLFVDGSKTIQEDPLIHQLQAQGMAPDLIHKIIANSTKVGNDFTKINHKKVGEDGN